MKINDKNFIQHLQLQEEAALEFIVDKYLPLIKGVSYKVLSPFNNKGIIEECVNDVFLSIWNNSNKFQGKNESDFKKWICAITKFKAIDYYRKANNKKESASEYIDLNQVNSAEDELIQLENRAELINLINRLDPVDRDIFIMKFLLGLKTRDISKKLGMTKASISNRIHRGKKKLNDSDTNFMLGGNSV
ncbi:MAG: sigma-70 family RNA polymerase sigma factor [Bacillaceae bacterium]|nr:sigma-70 family RNA polymerase sigma factor [Bacillaceae bacterium]